MSANGHSASENVVELMGAVTHALQTTAQKSASAGAKKLKKPEVVAALLKVLHSVVASDEHQPNGAKKIEAIRHAVSGSFLSDLDAIKGFVENKANGLV